MVWNKRKRQEPEITDYLHDILVVLNGIEGLLTGMANALDTVNDNLANLRHE